MIDQHLKRTYNEDVKPISIRAATEIPEIIPDQPALWYLKAQKLFHSDCYSQALVSYERALALQPDNCEAWIGRGCVLTHLDRYEAALASFTQALKIQPNNQTALIFQGMAYHHLGRYKQAYASYYQAIGKKRRSFWEKLLEFGR
jgi:tetratricopeptide (TPR) repeat protein